MPRGPGDAKYKKSHKGFCKRNANYEKRLANWDLEHGNQQKITNTGAIAGAGPEAAVAHVQPEQIYDAAVAEVAEVEAVVEAVEDSDSTDEEVVAEVVATTPPPNATANTTTKRLLPKKVFPAHGPPGKDHFKGNSLPPKGQGQSHASQYFFLPLKEKAQRLAEFAKMSSSQPSPAPKNSSPVKYKNTGKNPYMRKGASNNNSTTKRKLLNDHSDDSPSKSPKIVEGSGPSAKKPAPVTKKSEAPPAKKLAATSKKSEAATATKKSAKEPGESSDDKLMDLTPENIQKLLSDKESSGAEPPKDLKISPHLYTVMEYISSCTPKCHGNSNSVISSDRSHANTARVEWWDRNIGKGSICFTVPRAPRGEGMPAPSASYHSIEGTQILLARWHLAHRGLVIPCCNPEDLSCRENGGEMIRTGQCDFTTVSNYICCSDGTARYAFTDSYKCSVCDHEADGTVGDLLSVLPSYAASAPTTKVTPHPLIA